MKSPRRFDWPTLLRYGLLDLLLLVLFFIPLPVLDGHNFFYILKLSVSGSTSIPPRSGQAHPSESQLPEATRSKAWNEGYETGRIYGRMDRDAGTFDRSNPIPAVRQRIAAAYTEGTTESSDFWDGYRQGYATIRQGSAPANR